MATSRSAMSDATPATSEVLPAFYLGLGKGKGWG